MRFGPKFLLKCDRWAALLLWGAQAYFKIAPPVISQADSRKLWLYSNHPLEQL
jgi:hypothetical protein